MIGGPYLAGIFTPKGSGVYSITKAGFLIVSFSFLFSGVNIFSSALFTALSNGKLSAIISFLRSLVLLSIGILLLPLFLGTEGLWLAIPFAEGTTFLVSILFIWKKKETYHYI
jgi:Na+-driven multidrug efflux pump